MSFYNTKVLGFRWQVVLLVRDKELGTVHDFNKGIMRHDREIERLGKGTMEKPRIGEENNEI